MRWSVSVDLYGLYVLRGRGFLVVPLMDVMFRSGELEVTLLGNLVRRFFEAGGGEGADFQYGEKFQPPPCKKSRDYVIFLCQTFSFYNCT
jgi:hypothetical protein